jgi:TetR/AcrR family transcriptional regulator, repressor of fatR-cypB operon
MIERTDKQEAILQAALELFAERGFHGTAVPLVAERAGVGAGTIYRYFESKEALVNALYQHWKGALARALIEGLSEQSPPREQFHDLWRRLTDFARRHPLALEFLELHHHVPYLDAHSRAIELEILVPLVGLLERSRAQLVTKPMPSELLIAVVWGAFLGLLKASRQGFLELDDEMVELAETCAWEAIRR